MDLDYFKQFSGDSNYTNPKGDHLITLKVYDHWGKYRQYSFMVRLIQPAPVVVEVVEVKVWVPPEIVKATILSIDIFGEL